MLSWECGFSSVSVWSPSRGGVFALPDLWMILEVVAAALGLEAVSALPKMEVAFLASPHLLVVSWTRFRPG